MTLNLLAIEPNDWSMQLADVSEPAAVTRNLYIEGLKHALRTKAAIAASLKQPKLVPAVNPGGSILPHACSSFGQRQVCLVGASY